VLKPHILLQVAPHELRLNALHSKGACCSRHTKESFCFENFIRNRRVAGTRNLSRVFQAPVAKTPSFTF
jgi:hypothetical protein